MPRAVASSPARKRFEMDLEALLLASRAGIAAWQQPKVIAAGLPRHAEGGGPFRGLGALLLWEQRANARFLGWKLTAPSDEGAITDTTMLVPEPGTRDETLRIANPVTDFHVSPPASWATALTTEAALDLVLVELSANQVCDAAALRAIAMALLCGRLRLLRVAKPQPLNIPDKSSLKRLGNLAQVAADATLLRISPVGWLGERAFADLVLPYLPPTRRGAGGQGANTDARPILSSRFAMTLRTSPEPHVWWGSGALLTSCARAQQLGTALALPLTGDPVTDWLMLGRFAAMRLGELETTTWPQSLVGKRNQHFWRHLVVRHREATWPHQWHRLRYHDLVGNHRWNLRRLARMLYAARKRYELSTALDDLPLSLVPMHRAMAAVGRPPDEQHDEAWWAAALLRAAVKAAPMAQDGSKEGAPPHLPLGELWARLEACLAGPRYRRRPMAKANGGLRWLDVPTAELSAAQQLLHKLLLLIAPPNGAATGFLPHRSPVCHALAHTGARAAVVVDMQDFFGSVRPYHLEPWLMEARVRPEPFGGGLPSEWSSQGRRMLIDLLFARRPGAYPYLPQGAPSSPSAANLAAAPLDFAIQAKVRTRWGANTVAYTRYADDLVLSLHEPAVADGFIDEAHDLLVEAIEAVGWRPNPTKTRTWTATQGSPLVIGGVQVPQDRTQGVKVSRMVLRHGRAARHRLEGGACTKEEQAKANGTLSYLYAVLGHPGWLAWTSASLRRFAARLAGPVLAEAFLAGWDESLDIAADSSFPVDPGNIDG